ncbi:MAG: hypothetical protein V1791_07330 [Pseudomonadota bacterium]
MKEFWQFIKRYILFPLRTLCCFIASDIRWTLMFLVTVICGIFTFPTFYEFITTKTINGIKQTHRQQSHDSNDNGIAINTSQKHLPPTGHDIIRKIDTANPPHIDTKKLSANTVISRKANQTEKQSHPIQKQLSSHKGGNGFFVEKGTTNIRIINGIANHNRNNGILIEEGGNTTIENTETNYNHNNGISIEKPK